MKPHYVAWVLCTGRGLRTSEWWTRHLERDLARDWSVPWTTEARLTEVERQRIARSLAEFQRGESSSARRYLARAQRFAAATGDAAFHEASKIFVSAESVHAAELLRFMQAERIPPLQTTAADRIFRWLRGPLDLAWVSRMLLVAELIAEEYYPGLRAATAHPALRRLCDQIVSEERGHVRFQIERIARVEAQLPGWSSAWRDRAQSLVMTATIAVVWLGHRRVLGVRHGFRDFARTVWRRHRGAMAAIRVLRDGLSVSASYCVVPAVRVAEGDGGVRAGLRGIFSSRIADS